MVTVLAPRPGHQPTLPVGGVALQRTGTFQSLAFISVTRFQTSLRISVLRSIKKGAVLSKSAFQKFFLSSILLWSMSLTSERRVGIILTTRF